MERKNYLQEELSKEEKSYLKKLIINVRKKYIKNNYEWIFLQAKYAYFLNNDSNFSKFFEKYYKAISIQERIGKSKEYFMLEELAVKYRSKQSICEFVNERATDLSDINYILKMDYNSFIIFENEYKTAAPVADLNEKGGYYL